MSRWFVFLLALFAVTPAFADDLGEALKPWDIQLSNTMRYDHYATSGNSANSPFPASGSEYYDEFSGYASRDFSAYQHMHTDFTGLINEDTYRSPDKNVTVERANLFYENGEASVPYRLEVGDYFADMSYRTVQQSLKGAQIEFQPESKVIGNQSILVFSGVNNPSWQAITHSLDASSGASWLVENDLLGRAGLNLAYNYRNGTPSTGAATLPLNKAAQTVESVVDDKDFVVGTEHLNFDGELAHFYGDFLSGATTIRNRGDEGIYADLTGHSDYFKPLGYGIRYEDYGNNFRPAQAQIQSDHRGVEGQASWRFANGISLRGRADYYADGLYAQTNEQDTILYGATVQGPLLSTLAPDVSGRVDAYRQSVVDRTGVTHYSIDSLTTNFSKPITQVWSADASFLAQLQNDFTATNNDFNLYQYGAGVTRAFTWGDWSGSVHPGLLFRSYSGNIQKQFDVAPAFELHMSRDNQSVDFGYNVLYQNRSAPGIAYDKTQNLSLDYAYHMGAHDFGISGVYYDHNTTPNTAYTNASRIGVFWTYHLAKPAGQTEFSSGGYGIAMAGGSMDSTGEANVSLLTVLNPGMSKAEAKRQVAAAQIAGPVATPTSIVYETNLLSSIDLRQRLVLGLKGETLERASIVIDVQDASNLPQMQDDYARIRNVLLKTFGRPAKEYDPGSSIIAGSDNANSILQRFIEWRTQAGILRFGVTRGTDGVVRYEIQHAAGFGGASSTFWGVKF